MKYLNLLTQTLHSVPYIASDPTARATWLNVILWSCEQENGGVLVGALHWKNRQWQQTCGVSLREINAAGNLLTWKGDDLHVWEYPADKQVEVASKRDGGRTGGQSKTQAKTQAAKDNGAKGGRPKTQAETQAETQASDENNPSYNPTEGKGREGKGREGKYIAPADAAATREPDDIPFAEDKPEKPAKKQAARNPLIDALASVGGVDPLQIPPRAWGAIGAALADIRAVCPELTPEEIARRGANYRTHYPSASLTAPALAKHWAVCDHPASERDTTVPWQRKTAEVDYSAGFFGDGRGST